MDELSAAMAQARAEAVDREIQTWQEKICKALSLDRSVIYESETPGKVRRSHIWVRANFPQLPKKFHPEKFVNSGDWVFSGNQLVFSRPSEIPPEWKEMRRAVEQYGPKASAIFPMRAGDRVIGAVSFGKFSAPRRWSPQLLHRLELSVRIFGSAIERKQAKAALRVARSELAVTQRRSMMGELVASLAHELNQPHGAILSNLDGLGRLLAQGNLEPEKAVRAIENAIEDTKRAGEIVRRVRAMFKGDRSEKAAVDIGEMISEVVTLIRREAALRGISVEIEASLPIPPVFGDRVLLQQCIVNLLLNAFDAVDDLEDDRRKVTLSVASRRPGWIEIDVSDRGTGIDQSIAGRLFEPFVTTKSKGMGLGLLVTRSIVEDHGGKIFFEPARDGGTTFTFALPVADMKRARRETGRKKDSRRRPTET